MPLNTKNFPYMDKNFRSYRLITKMDPAGKRMTATGERYSIYRQFAA